MATPFTEGLLAICALLVVVLLLGLAWLFYLGKGGKPFYVSVKGLGISVDVKPYKERS